MDGWGDGHGRTAAEAGGDHVTTNVMPDGGDAGELPRWRFDRHWLSETDITTTVELSGRAMEMTVQSRAIPAKTSNRWG